MWLHPSDGDGLYNLAVAYISKGIWGAPRPMTEGTALLVMDGDGVIGGALVNNYCADSGVVEISGAAESPRWLDRKTLRELFGFIFDQMGCQAAVMRADVDNKRVDRIARAYGFKRYDIPRLRGRDKAESIFVLGDDDWRANGFHKERANGQESS